MNLQKLNPPVLVKGVCSLMLTAIVTVIATVPGRSWAEERHYLVAGPKNILPNPAAIAAAGGKWTGQIPSIGVALVKSSNPDFLTLVKKSKSVELAAHDTNMHADDNPGMGPAEDLSATADPWAEDDGQAVDSGSSLGDTFSFLQWSHLPQVMDITGAHNRGITGQGVAIAVVDSGIDCTHPDFIRPDGTSAIVYSHSFAPINCTQDADCQSLPTSTCDPNSKACVLADGSTGYSDPCNAINTHGTNVTGIISAVCGNGKGVCGIAPDADIINLKTHDNGGWPLSRELQAFDWIANVGAPLYGIRILNHSSNSFDREDVDLYGILNRATALLFKRGVVMFTSAGQGGVNVSENPDFFDWPALSSAHTIAVGSTGPCCAACDGNVFNESTYDILVGDSNFGFDPDEQKYVVMPGGMRPGPTCVYPKTPCQVGNLKLNCQSFDMIPTTTRQDILQPGLPSAAKGYTVFSGTSAAAPHASGLAALLLSRFPDLSAGQLTEAMLGTGDLGIDLTLDIGGLGYDLLFGYGRGSAAMIP
jgi:lantibiotic leader peptide-processing serine protease